MWPTIVSPDRSVYCLRTPLDQPIHKSGQPAESINAEEEPVFGYSDRLLCRQCLVVITNQSEQTEVSGSFRHTFANPHGIVFEIGCFRDAGCGFVGRPTDEFTWFAGYYWQVAICTSCLTHVGWRFTAIDKTNFFGLILDRLVSPTSASPH